MYREAIGATLILLVFAIALLIYVSVRRRRLLQESLLPNLEILDMKEALFHCLYVATVFSDRPLERVWAHGLGGRGRATVGLSDANLVIDRIGERAVVIPLREIQALRRGGATIDRGVERSGLVQIQWPLGGTNLLTSLRITSNQEESFLKLKEAIGG